MSVRVDVCAQMSVSMDKYVNMCECVFMFVSALKLPRVAIHPRMTWATAKETTDQVDLTAGKDD